MKATTFLLARYEHTHCLEANGPGSSKALPQVCCLLVSRLGHVKSQTSP